MSVIKKHDIWIWHLARETLERLTLEPTFEQYWRLGT